MGLHQPVIPYISQFGQLIAKKERNMFHRARTQLVVTPGMPFSCAGVAGHEKCYQLLTKLLKPLIFVANGE